jgi:hypothetical protein
MATFTEKPIKDTYYRVVQLDDGGQIQNGLGHPLSGSLRISGSVHITGSSTIGGDLDVTGKVTAREFIATTVSSSVLFESGSSQFGNSLDDSHIFTGSIHQTGSLTISGSIDTSGSLTIQNTITADRGVIGGIFYNPNTIEENINIPINQNARLFGPTVTIDNGKLVTVGAGSILTIL